MKLKLELFLKLIFLKLTGADPFDIIETKQRLSTVFFESAKNRLAKVKTELSEKEKEELEEARLYEALAKVKRSRSRSAHQKAGKLQDKVDKLEELLQ